MQRQTQLANDLWPLLLPRIQAMISASASSGGGSTGGAVSLAAHELGGSLHKGTLRNDQAPQFLLTDGTRSLAGSLAVDAGVTIDGVDLSAHAADINAHHAKLHAITDAANHSVTGSQYQIVGLTAVNTLGLLTPSASPAANAVVKTDGASGVTLVDLTVTSDLFMSGYLDFGTDVIYEDASYLQVTGSKAVRFGQNIGNAAWTIYNTGGYTTTGSISITGTAGDLTIGSNVLFVDNSGNNVGIACVPDAQFALDVAGPARAQYWIGPHALQIPDALMICHYDGATPYNTNFNGIALGHKGQIGTSTGGVIYRPGKFGKALQVADATTNLFWDSSCEYDASLTLWGTTVTGGTLTKSRSSEVPALYGSYVAKLVQSSSGTGTFYQSMAPAAGTIGLSCYVRKADKSAVTSSDCTLYFGTDLTTTYTSIGGGWYRLTASVSASGATYSAGINVKTSKTVYADGFQAEATIITPYADGTLGSGYAWSGTAYQSSSTRTSGTMAYTISTISTDSPSTIMAWVNLDTATSKNYHYLWYVASDSYSAYVNSSRTLFVGTINCGTLPAGWVHVALAHDGGGGIWVYVNGVQIGSSTITRANLRTFNVGGHSSGLCCNGLVDDFAIIGRLLPDDEVRAVYESNAPVFAESSTVSWVATPGGLVWADAEGLWMKDTTAKPVLGVYGGEATKSWGGFTMSPGDLLIGNNSTSPANSAAILWTKASGKFGFYGAGNSTPQVEIATDGSLTAGAGNVALNAAGAYIITGSTPDNFLQAFSFKTAHAGAVVSSFQGYVDGSANDHGGIRVGRLSSGHDADVFVLANSLSGDISTGTFGSVNTSGSNYRSLIVTRADGSTANVQTYIDANVVATIDAKGINGKTIYSSGDSGGVASTVAITNDVQGTGAGTGTIKMNGATSRNSSGWLKIWYGTNAYYVPLFSTVTG